MIEIFTAKSGASSLRIDGIALHSPYDPAREARRFVEGSIGPAAPATVILLGECLGHVAEAVRSIHQHARVVRIIYSEEIARAARADPGPAWHPGSGIGLADFLHGCLAELDVEGLQVIEWPPAARLFPAMSRSANDAVRQVVQELNGSFVTTVGAGRLWIRNSFANFLGVDSVLVGEPCASDRPVLVAAPGPTLETALPLIAEVRHLVDLWALPSSSLILREAGIAPDLLVMTDPGYYSLHHLHFAPPPCPVAMPLSAARGTWRLPSTADGGRGPALFLLAQPVVFEKALIEAARVNAPLIAPHGTVAATALALAVSSTRAPVVFAGLDMCLRDIASHARPSSFDQLLLIQASRLAPHYSLSYLRAAGQRAERIPGREDVRASSSLRTYAGWFDRQATTVGRAYRLLPSAVALGGLQDIDPASFRSLLRGAGATRRGPRLRLHEALPSRADRKTIAARLLRGWTADLEAMRAAASIRNWAGLLGSSSAMLSLAYCIEPRLLVEARRKSRQGDLPGALSAAEGMLGGCIDFLSRLVEKIADGT